jgi:hypothetical protein
MTGREHRRRRLGRLGAAACAAVWLACGCSLAGEQVESVVYFNADATDVQRDAVRNACPGVGHARLEPRDRSDLSTARTYPIRYDITKASTQDVAQLTSCVAAQPGVKGVSTTRDGG